jgi:hypothetical protein
MARTITRAPARLRVGRDYVCLNFGSPRRFRVCSRSWDKRPRSRWSRVLRYSAEYKSHSEPLAAFVRRKGGINECAAIDRVVNPAGPNQRRSARRAPVTRSFSPKCPAFGRSPVLTEKRTVCRGNGKLQEASGTLSASLSLIRATSLPGSARQAPGHAVARDHARLPSRDGRFVAPARWA